MADQAMEDYLQERAAILDRGVKQAEEVDYLKRELRRQRTENIIWRTMVAHIRDVGARYAPILAQARELDWVYKLMRDDQALRKEVDRRIDEEDEQQRRWEEHINKVRAEKEEEGEAR